MINSLLRQSSRFTAENLTILENELQKALLANNIKQHRAVISSYRNILRSCRSISKISNDDAVNVRDSVRQFLNRSQPTNNRYTVSSLPAKISMVEKELSVLAKNTDAESISQNWKYLKYRFRKLFNGTKANSKLSAKSRIFSRSTWLYMRELERKIYCTRSNPLASHRSKYRYESFKEYLRASDKQIKEYISLLKFESKRLNSLTDPATASQRSLKRAPKLELKFTSGVWFIWNRYNKHDRRSATAIHSQVKHNQNVLNRVNYLNERIWDAWLEDSFENNLSKTSDYEISPGFSWLESIAIQKIALDAVEKFRKRRMIHRAQRKASVLKAVSKD